jgi:hypothetical protein
VSSFPRRAPSPPLSGASSRVQHRTRSGRR